MKRLLSSVVACAALSLSVPAAAGPARVIPYAGVIEKNGASFSGLATLNFALFDCAAQSGACSNASTQLYVASGSGTFPPGNAAGIGVTPNDGKFSVLIGDTGMAALPAGVFATQQLFVRIAIKAADGSWIPLTGFQRIAPVASAITAEEAQSFTVRQSLAVTGSTTVGGTLSVQGGATLGATTVNGNLTANSGSATLGATTTSSLATGNVTASGVTASGGVTAATVSTTGAATVGAVQLRKNVNTSRIGFDAQQNDPGEIVHKEVNNVGELWLSSSDDWSTGASNDRVIFGDVNSTTVRHSFSANGDARHTGNLTVDGNITMTCRELNTPFCSSNARTECNANEFLQNVRFVPCGFNSEDHFIDYTCCSF